MQLVSAGIAESKSKTAQSNHPSIKFCLFGLGFDGVNKDCVCLRHKEKWQESQL